MLSLPWAVKLLLTVLLGGLFASGVFFIFIAADNMRDASFPLVCGTITAFSTTVFASFLHWREGKGWQRSLLMGVAVGLTGTAIIILIGLLFNMWLVSNIQLV
jgi:hypothetical protein